MAILPAADLERARTFYADRLNLRPADIRVPAGNIAFESGDGTLLFIYAREGGTKADHTVAGWLVDDVEKTVEELGEKGIIFEQYDLAGLKTDERGIAEMGGARAAWFKDPDGNILAITETPD
jgi:catechol 2,3-dioxygenase-like lactoylglutathione lyase family enzyme